VAAESGIIQHLRRQIATMEKKNAIVYAGAAIAKSKCEISTRFERHALDALTAATDSLGCKYLNLIFC
jgi:hypothetical protein